MNFLIQKSILITEHDFDEDHIYKEKILMENILCNL